MGRFKENELTGDQSMVVEVDPTSLQKARNPVSLHAKARKSFPKSSHSAAAIKVIKSTIKLIKFRSFESQNDLENPNPINLIEILSVSKEFQIIEKLKLDFN